MCVSDGKFWDFTADLARVDTAYTNLALPAHTDTTYFVRVVPSHIRSLLFLSHLNAYYADGPLRTPTLPLARAY